MTNLYEAIGLAVGRGEAPNTLLLNHPEKPFVNIGYHQVVEREINISYCKEKGFDIVRRSVGGGAILDGPWEQDYFIMINRGNPECPKNIPKFYEKFLKPVIYVIHSYGLEAVYKPINDVLTRNKKISANGALTVENANVLVGDILLEAPTELMTQILKVPNEKFRNKLAKSMNEWLTSLKNELGFKPPREEVKKKLVEGFEKELGIKFEAGTLTSKEKKYFGTLLEERESKEWIFRKKITHKKLFEEAAETRCIKVRGGIYVCEVTHKAEKLIRVTVEIHGNKISEISISGDFFTQPYTGALTKLEQELIGTLIQEKILKNKIEKVMAETDLKIFGATPKDLVEAIIKTKRKLQG